MKSLAQVERNQQQLKTNADTVCGEIDEIQRRLTLALKERTDYLKSSVDKYVGQEMKSLKELKDNLDLEVTNIRSNSDLMEKNLDDGTKWDDIELLDCKEIFIKMMDWIRNYDTSNEEYTRRIRFTCHDGVNDLARRVLELGDLKMQENNPSKSSDDYEPRSSGLSRSKSDHRLVSEFRRQEENSSPTRSRRAFGYSREANKSRSNMGRYGGEEEDDSSYSSSRFSSRFLSRTGDDDGSDDRRNSRHLDEEPMSKKERNKVIETEDASRGPLSGCIRLADSSRVIQRLKEHEMELARPKKEPSPKKEAVKAPVAAKPAVRPAAGGHGQCTPGIYDARLKTLKDGQDDDEIDQIKKDIKEAAKKEQKKSTSAAPTTAAAAAPAPKPAPAPTPAPAPAPAPITPKRQVPEPAPVVPTPVAPARRTSATTVEPPTAAARKSSTSGTAGASVRASRATSPNSIVNKYASPASTTSYYAQQQAAAQEASPDSDFSSSDDSSSDTSSDEDDDEGPNSNVVVGDDGYEYEYYDDDDETPALAPVNAGPTSILRKTTAPAAATSSPYSSGYGTAAEPPSRNTSSAYGSSQAQASPSYGASSASSYGASSGYGATTSEARPTRTYSGARTTGSYGGYEEPSAAAPLSPSAARRSSQYGSGRYTSPAPEPSSSVLSERRFSREDSSDSGGRYATRKRDDSDSFVSRYLAKSRTSGALTSEQKEPTPDESASRRISGELQYPSGRSRYAALKERKARLAKSKSSATIGLGGGDDDDDDDAEEILTPFTSRFGGELARSRSSHMLKNESSPTASSASRQPEGNEQDENLSSWAKYLKNKYGGRSTGAGGTAPSAGTAESSREQEKEDRRARLGLSSGSSSSRPEAASSSYEQSKNATGSPAPTPLQPLAGSGGIGSMPSSQYLSKQALVLKFGARGSQPGFFTWPRGIAVGPDNTVVVADSSNHRVQIFDEHGQNRFWLGGYGNGEGEFDCLAGVAVNRIGQFIIADRYNHRIQIFDPSGHFLRTFGSQGSDNGKFNYPWGICTDALGFIYVCDKENHRIQVFQSDGTFVAKFGSMGSKPGQLEHPHYIAVSNTNRVIVSDSNNHRLQIFDVNGKVLTTFGSEGTEEGQFKFPRGVAVDEGGFIFVAVDEGG